MFVQPHGKRAMATDIPPSEPCSKVPPSLSPIFAHSEPPTHRSSAVRKRAPTNQVSRHVLSDIKGGLK